MDADQPITILAELAETNPTFASEDGFHDRLYDRIRGRGIEVTSKPTYECDLILNERSLIPDMVVWQGHSGTVIELKHVMADGGRPANPSGFSYDVIKDCAKIECLLQEREGTRPLSDGVVIGMTDFPTYWETHPGADSTLWSTNFLIRDEDSSNWRLLRRRLFEVVRTDDRPKIGNAVFVNDRCHIGLKRWWEYRWIDYSQCSGRQLRYIALRPCRTDRWTGLDAAAAVGPLTTVPFHSISLREQALRFREECRAKYRSLRERQPD